MKGIYIIGNMIWIKINKNSNYGSEKTLYMLCGRRGGLVMDAILTSEDLMKQYPGGEWRNGINVSDTISFEDK